MKIHTIIALLVMFLFSSAIMPLYASGLDGSKQKISSPALKSEAYSIKKDIAFVSVMGSRPDARNLKGFQRAVLFNAQGAKVKEITFSKSDSVYSLDKMIQENKNIGPLIIRMYR